MVINMKLVKYIGILCLICMTFFYTEKVIEISINQDDIMIKIKDEEKYNNINPSNAIIKDDTIIPGSTGKSIDTNKSYKAMKKIGYYEPSLLVYNKVYPEISIYNNYNKYIISGNTNKKNISLIYIINNNNTIDNILSTIAVHNVKLNFFIDSSYLNNNINIINKLKDNEIYNYGKMGIYTKDNLIITNNIINNKSNNKSIYCLFLNRDETSLNNCANNKMLSLIPATNINYLNIKNNLENGKIILIDNTKELNGIIEYIKNKGYSIVPLSELIIE